MTVKEFQAWFQGFMTGIGDREPTSKDWAKVFKKVGEIREAPPVIVHDVYKKSIFDDYQKQYPGPRIYGDSSADLPFPQTSLLSVLQNMQGENLTGNRCSEKAWDFN